jgi:geranylgeranyl pyrophosphate synthase
MAGDAQRAVWTAPAGLESLAPLRAVVEARLAELAPSADAAVGVLAEAMRYALLAPGKRTRPVLTLLCARRFGASVEEALDVGCAFEMVHAASLIFDDLPCMDDAAQRRGRPTAHLRFGEDAAVLAGVALLNEAYGVLARSALPDAVVRRLVDSLSRAIGIGGLVGGQMRDLRETAEADADSLLRLNHEKTGALFCAAGEAGALLGGAGEREAGAVCAFARHVGAAFQIRDDLLDGATLDVAGKDVGQDAGKPTFVSLLGVEGARRRLQEETAAARMALASIGGPGELGAFSDGLLALDWLEPKGRSGHAEQDARTA